MGGGAAPDQRGGSRASTSISILILDIGIHRRGDHGRGDRQVRHAHAPSPRERQGLLFRARQQPGHAVCLVGKHRKAVQHRLDVGADPGRVAPDEGAACFWR
jgi:hypothetical protein